MTTGSVKVGQFVVEPNPYSVGRFRVLMEMGPIRILIRADYDCEAEAIKTAITLADGGGLAVLKQQLSMAEAMLKDHVDPLDVRVVLRNASMLLGALEVVNAAV